MLILLRTTKGAITSVDAGLVATITPTMADAEELTRVECRQDTEVIGVVYTRERTESLARRVNIARAAGSQGRLPPSEAFDAPER